ncbi:putative sodium-dependent multivitamin transporter [Topomyia yanbarensis]|uniref:putative sodium-dependent multivitamin transporter n=1 Tax=Topomyia yanbarensis TaxID=2498891 RepID=UPI00273B22E2|nr:putative sodium-dependent multivitamin transporter [Topomyia yanbarensis]XP_058824325.1 putative sodium-dependent multivitamin transporter [Topomyia yanbarensis]
MASFGVWDYAVLVVVLLVSAGIGVYYRFSGGKQKTTTEYLLADRNMSIWPVSFSLMASFMSAITLLGVSNENYQFGTQFVVINISYGLATPIAAYLFLPVFFKLEASSAYEYLELRFGKKTRLVASFAYLLQMILYMGIAVYAPALALEAVTGLPQTYSILTIGIICTFYSTIGGMKAVLFTDLFQSFLMFAAIFAVIICAGIDAGGLGKIWETAERDGRLEFWNFDPDPTTRHTWWSLTIGGMFTYLSLYAVNQTQVQRLKTVKDLKTAQRALWLNWPILSLLSLTTSFSGLAIYYYYSTCDPLKQGRITVRDQTMPLFVVDAMGNIPGLPGLFVSGIFSASLSTVSAALNSLAAVTLEDYLKPIYAKVMKRSLPDMQSSFPTKVMAAIYGVVCLAVAFIAQFMGGVLQASLTIFGVVGGPLFALFTMGMFTKRANQRGVITGLLIGISFSLWIGFGQPKPPLKMLDFSVEDCSRFGGYNSTTISPMVMAQRVDRSDDSDYFYLYRLSYLWSVVLGYIVTFVVGYSTSLLLRWLGHQGAERIYLDNDKIYINTDLFSPPVAKRMKRTLAKHIENGGDIEITKRNGNTKSEFSRL